MYFNKNFREILYYDHTCDFVSCAKNVGMINLKLRPVDVSAFKDSP